MSEPPDEYGVPLVELEMAWHILTAVASNYEPSGEGWASLIEARRLIEVEVREQYGDGPWQRLTDDDYLPDSPAMGEERA